MHMLSDRLISIFSFLFLAGCQSAYLAELNFKQSVNDYSALVADFEEVCTKVNPESSLFDISNNTWAKDYKKITACRSNRGYLQPMFFLVSSNDVSKNHAVLWGIPSGHLGTSVGNFSFPKWYCEDYLEIYNSWKKKHDIQHDEKLFKKCVELD